MPLGQVYACGRRIDAGSALVAKSLLGGHPQDSLHPVTEAQEVGGLRRAL